jgi:hypothetical protein
MSWQIPTQIEQDIIAGKAKYQTFQTGNGGQSILQVPPNSYVVIFGYDFSPAGGGLKVITSGGAAAGTTQNGTSIRWFETQQISFYTGTDFYPFIHHCDVKTNVALFSWDSSVPDNNFAKIDQFVEEIDNTPISRQVYITSPTDITITHGLILNTFNNTMNAIPITNRTPQGLSYGGSPQVMNTQTNYGGAAPLQFMQPSPKDYLDFGFGLLPSNADNQAFATPDAANGLLASTTHLFNIGGDTFTSAAASNYYLCMHYAIYSKTIPEQRG